MLQKVRLLAIVGVPGDLIMLVIVYTFKNVYLASLDKLNQFEAHH